ncbi:MAG TPA: RluA family pseudouridine synthase [Hyphomicrobiaceae bacterium]|nr:RluA family pseudouridine synthase [Hyphomicrobiaceae bacterium]
MSGQTHHRYRFSVGEDAAQLRLDRFLTDRIAGATRSRVQALIRQGMVRSARGTLVDAGARVKLGEVIEIDVPEAEAPAPAAEPIPLNVVYEDRHVIVIDKPAGLVVHPAAGHGSGTLVNALIAHCGTSLSGIGGVKRPGIVHRLDKGTSGLMVVAKTDAAHAGLARQFAAHGSDGSLSRAYLALVWGVPRRPRGTVDAPLKRSTANRTKIAVSDGGRRAITHYALEQVFNDARGKPALALVRARLMTGRTHQIRVHFAHIGHPLLGDPTYGASYAASARKLAPEARAALARLGRQALHAAHLGFLHPVTGERLAFDSAPPADFAQLLNTLQFGCKLNSG